MCAYVPSQPSKEEEKQLKIKIIRTFLTPEARQRLNNVRIVKPELAEFVENQIVQLVLSGKLKRQITEEEIKEILGSIAERERREFRIRRV